MLNSSVSNNCMYFSIGLLIPNLSLVFKSNSILKNLAYGANPK